jgi:hypothetical protein
MKRLTLSLLMLALGCSVEPCDPGQTQDQLGFCVPPVASAGSSDAGAPPEAVAGAPAGGAGGAGGAPVCEAPSSFGDECSASSECRCEVEYCAIQPNQTSGICTRTGCVEDPSVCPDDWQCIDLSAFMADLPSICVPPA